MHLNTIPARMAWLRDLLGVSARAAADAVGLSNNVWSQLERGVRMRGSLETFEMIAARCGITPEWLTFGRAEMFAGSELDPAKASDHEAIGARLRRNLGLVEGTSTSPGPSRPPRKRSTTGAAAKARGSKLSRRAAA